jgi:pyrroline-5-carboxylate reductase
MKIIIIGGGNMGQSYVKSFLDNDTADTSELSVYEISADKKEIFTNMGVKNFYTQPGAYLEKFDLILLAVKPQNFKELVGEIVGYISKDQVVLSIMAGIEIEQIQSHLKVQKVIRVMPNLAAQIGQGMSVLSSSAEVSRIELVTVQNLLESTGKNLYVSDEMLINAGTAVSGSGPAYVLYFMKSMKDTAIELGFTKAQAELLIYQTFKGILEFYKNHNDSCDDLIKKVASKGGTTEAALKVFEEFQLDKTIHKALYAAYNRAVELGKSSSDDPKVIG